MNKSGKVNGVAKCFSPMVTKHQKGVCILLHPSTCNLSIESQYSNVDVRIVLVNLSFRSTKLSLCIFSTLNGFVCSNVNISQLILGGNWKVALKAFDKSGGIPWRPTAYREQVLALSWEFKLVDILRVKNPNGKFSTYESRIDFFLITKSWVHLVSVAHIKISIAPDHRAVKLGIKMAMDKRGQAFGSLKDQMFITLLENSYLMI